MNERLPTTPIGASSETLNKTSEAQEEQRRKTLAVRLDEHTHAKLAFIAQLSGSSIADEIRRSIEYRITAAQEDPDLIARAEHVQQQIEREAQARAAAIAGFLGSSAVAAVEAAPETEAGSKKTATRRSGGTTSNK